MKITDLDGAMILAAAFRKDKRELGIVKNGGLIMMTLEEAVGPEKVAFTLIPAKIREGDEDDQAILFDAITDVVVMWYERRIDRFTKELAKLGIEP